MRNLHPLFVLLLIGCGDKAGDSDTDPSAPTEEVGVLITAADGGTVEAGEASLDIPAGALAEDTTITIAVSSADGLPDSGSVVGDAYDFGPNGTAFLTPAELTIDAGAAPAADQVYVLSWLDETTDSWVDLPSTVSGTSVTAPVEHFTMFVIRSVDAPAGLDVCEIPTPCGGDPVGKWSLIGYCVDLGNPLEQSCPTATFEATVETDGTYDFLADGTLSYDVTTTFSTTWTMPAECLGNITDCSQLEGEGAVCTGDAAVSCTCTDAQDPSNSANTGTWVSTGTVLTITEDVNAYPYDYCVTGDIMKLFVSGGEEGVITFQR